MSFIVGEVLAPIVGDISPFERSLGQGMTMGGNFVSSVGKTMSSLGNSIKDVGTSLTKYITLPLAGAATAIFKLGKDFESELSKVTGLVGVAGDQVDEWGQDILEMAPKLGKAPQELAEALFFVTSAGIKGAEAMDVLEMSAKASAAGLGETSTIADLVTSAMNAYGKENLSASQATDIVTAAVREGKAEASALAGSMGAVLPIASEMGVTFDQVAAAQAAMTRTGTSADEAATQLKSILSGLIKPSKQAEEQLRAMGTSSSDMRKKIKDEGLLSALSDLREMTNKYGEEAMARVFPNIRALMGVLDLMGSNAESNTEIFDALSDSTGSLDDAFSAASETLDFKWNQALSQVQATAISFFDVLKVSLIPVLDIVTKSLSFVAEKFKSLDPNIQKIIVVIAALATAMGPVLVVVGTVMATLGGAIAGVGTAITAIGGIISTIGIPVLLAIIAACAAFVVAITGIITCIAAWVASFVKLYKTNKDFREKVINVWNVIKTSAIDIFNEIKDTIIYIFNLIKDFWKKHGDEVMAIFQTVWSFILDLVEIGAKNLKDIVKMATSLIEGDWDTAWESMKDIIVRSWDFIKEKVGDVLSWLVNKIKEKFGEIKEKIEEKLDDSKNAIIDWVTNLPENVEEGLENLKTKIKEKFDEIKEKIQGKLENWGNVIGEWFESIPSKITKQLELWKESILKWMKEQNKENKKQFGKWWESIKEWFEGIPDKLNEKMSLWGEAIGEWFKSMKKKIGEKLNSWYTKIKEWFEDMPGKIGTLLVDWKKTITDWYEDMKKKTKEKLDGWWKTIKEWFIGVPNKPEIKDAGKNIVTNLEKGISGKKGSFEEKLGKLIVDAAKFALAFAVIALISTGREIVKRLMVGVDTLKSSMYQSGVNLIQSLINGIYSKFADLGRAAGGAASLVRSYWPFSPAKKGPLRDLDKVDFAGPLLTSLDNAQEQINKHFLGNVILNGVDERMVNVGSTNTNTNPNISGTFNFNGIQDVVEFMQEMRSLTRRVGGRSYG